LMLMRSLFTRILDVSSYYLRLYLGPNRWTQDILKYSNRYRLVDVYSNEYGGTGERINLDWFDGIDCSKIILAGGLTPENLYEVKKYNFFGVDVRSGVEKIKGRKDHQKVKQFI